MRTGEQFSARSARASMLDGSIRIKRHTAAQRRSLQGWWMAIPPEQRWQTI